MLYLFYPGVVAKLGPIKHVYGTLRSTSSVPGGIGGTRAIVENPTDDSLMETCSIEAQVLRLECARFNDGKSHLQPVKVVAGRGEAMVVVHPCLQLFLETVKQ